MKTSLCSYLFLIVLNVSSFAQSNTNYSISFENAEQHEAVIEAEFSGLENKILELRMSRTSPGRYALHEFAKNVFDLSAWDENGNELTITRPNPYQWNISGHNGFVKIKYRLFANRGDGTYTQVDLTHAHLNIPATFIYAPALNQNPIIVKFNVREDLNWRIATQLKEIDLNTFYAPNLQYFMDSPTEISDFDLQEFDIKSNEKTYKIRFALHHNGTEAEFETYFKNVKKVVLQEMTVYGELPDFDYGMYTFLGCYIPNASGDGMEHRNSTVLTTTRSLADGGAIGTVSHEFFHAWNVERIRPLSLEPFNFEEVNMSGELWFAEGFTSYYTDLLLCRAGIITQADYINQLPGGLNYVWSSPARQFKNPIEMSYMAPFVDAAKAVDPVNWENTFISYYTYGSVLGLALDLSLRKLNNKLNMDGYLQLVWKKFGKTEIPYTVKDVQSALAEYAGIEFAGKFFDNYIYKSEMPDYQSLLSNVGVIFKKIDEDTPYIGVGLRIVEQGGLISSNPTIGNAAYLAGLSFGDLITSFDGIELNEIENFDQFLKTNFKPGQRVKVAYIRYGTELVTDLTFGANPGYTTYIDDMADNSATKRRNNWLNSK